MHKYKMHEAKALTSKLKSWQALAQEITAEYDQEVLTSLRSINEPEITFGYDIIADNKPVFQGDLFLALTVMINSQANVIASRTRRGAGNWVVLSPTALTILQSASGHAYKKVPHAIGNFVGTLNESISVYLDSYAADTTPVIIGYKNPDRLITSEDGVVKVVSDAAAIFSPYVLVTSGTLPNQTNSLMCRFAYNEIPIEPDSISASDYIRSIGMNVSNISFA